MYSYWYYDSVACLVYLLGVTESDQVVGRVLVVVMHGVIYSPGFQAYIAYGVLIRFF